MGLRELYGTRGIARRVYAVPTSELPLRDLLLSIWLAVMLIGYAVTLFFEGGLSLGFSVDLFLPVYVLMIAGVILSVLRPGGGRRGDGSAAGGGAAYGR